MNKILKIGHRGAKGYVAENTLDSFQKAIDLGCDGIELDVHLSSDQKVVVIHDETIDRTTTGKGFVKDFTASELKKFGIPTLEEVFDLVNQNCFINVELKGEHTAKFVVAIIEKYILEKNWSNHHFLISSFDWNALHEVHNLHPEIPIGVLTQTDLDLAFAFAKFIKAKSIHPYFHLLTKEKVETMQENGYLVFPWTVNELEDIEKIKLFNVNGIISDFPDRIN
jgi:glycerophosphoryl diester phosphodiesterase